LLGRLAVDDRYRGQGFGALLLADALLRAKGNTSRVGSVAVVVNAKDENARGFYERFGFRLLCDAERQLFLPMAMIVEP
jgi:GNAT superfamily N-acetyltransferase